MPKSILKCPECKGYSLDYSYKIHFDSIEMTVFCTKKYCEFSKTKIFTIRDVIDD